MFRKISFIIIICIVFLVTIHCSPTLAIRTKLVTSGHFISAFTTNIETYNKDGIVYQPYEEYENKHNAQVYLLSNPPTSRYGTGDMILEDIIVYQHGPIFIAKYVYDELHKIMDV